jgi:hypothetical protein
VIKVGEALDEFCAATAVKAADSVEVVFGVAALFGGVGSAFGRFAPLGFEFSGTEHGVGGRGRVQESGAWVCRLSSMAPCHGPIRVLG